ncbi:MAG TPA: hypothetical protein VHU83_06650 [Bryobacteraceae bacterium]|jgi:hypothetical protein|nr:hypothetical protein [Bryobacteraceae bacterium]
MNQSLLTAHGAQPEKPSRYKPIWTDRFFTGYFTNRSPLRSPLSAFYAEGWNLGKTDTLIDGSNVEVSPRLTLIRRPGNTASSPAIPQAPKGFYSFHRSDGVIYPIVDTLSEIYALTSGTLTTLYTKTTGAGQATFQGIGTQLYWGDGTTAKAWDSTNPTITVRQMGITAPVQAPGLARIANSAGTGATITGANFSGGYVSTSLGSRDYATLSIEAFVKIGTGATANSAIASFESSQTGSSLNVFHVLYLNSSGEVCYAILDGNTGQMNVTNSQKAVTDSNWHMVTLTMTYAATLYQATTFTSGTPIKQTSVGAQNYTPDSTLPTNFAYVNAPVFSSGPSPRQMQVSIYVDGQLAGIFNPSLGALSNAVTGYWRLGNCTGWSGQSFGAFNGLLSNVSIYTDVIPGQMARFNELMVGGGLSAYQEQVLDIPPQFYWYLNETSGTTAIDQEFVNNGTYQGSPTLNQSAQAVYLPYTASTAYSQGQYIVDSNGNLQACSYSGTSGSSAPSWKTNIGQSTVDGTVTWVNSGAVSLTLTIGTQYGFCYVNKYGHFSTLSPLMSPVGPRTGINVTMVGLSSPDPQVTQIAIFRTPDGGTTPFYIDSIPNPPTALWGFVDFTPESNLNVLMAGPQAHSNDPPPQGLINLVYHLGRMWGSVGNVLYCSGGPDTLVGDGNEAWPPANSWSFPSPITRLVPTASGLIVLTSSGIQMMAGGPAISQFYPQPMFEKIGLSSYNALDTNGTQITLFTSDRQLITIDPSTGLVDIGFPIADKLAQLSPTSVYVTHHHSGLDNALYIADGSTGWYRCVPMQPPDFSITGPVWSPKATVNGGNCGAIASIETSPGVYQLFVGSTSANQPVLTRDSTYTAFNDAGSAYDAFFTVGSIILANPGELAELSFLTCDFIRVGSSPSVSVLLDEISGTFSPVMNVSVSDPPQIYGATGAPVSLYANRYYFSQTGQPAWSRHLQVKCDFGNNAVMNEILSSTIFGAILVEGA